MKCVLERFSLAYWSNLDAHQSMVVSAEVLFPKRGKVKACDGFAFGQTPRSS